ncbi:MAG TPA: hypothetical protein VIJ29_00625 [Candidatus Paceibacterota bacterium]
MPRSPKNFLADCGDPLEGITGNRGPPENDRLEHLMGFAETPVVHHACQELFISGLVIFIDDADERESFSGDATQLKKRHRSTREATGIQKKHLTRVAGKKHSEKLIFNQFPGAYLPTIPIAMTTVGKQEGLIVDSECGVKFAPKYTLDLFWIVIRALFQRYIIDAGFLGEKST